MKKLCSLLVLLCLLLGLTVTVHAADEGYLFDQADLLSDDEEAALEMVLAQAHTYGCGVYIAAVEDLMDWGAYDAYSAAQNIYADMGCAEDGILLMISMADRDYALICHGYLGNAMFDSFAMDDIEDAFLDDLGRNDWLGGFEDYASACISAMDSYDPSAPAGSDAYQEPYQDVPYVPAGIAQRLAWMSGGQWLLVLGVPFALALIVCLMMKSGMKTAGIATRAGNYIPKGGVNLTARSDIYTHSTTRVIHHEPPKSSGGGGIGGGGGFSGRSGKF